MTPADIARTRLTHQHVNGFTFKTAKELVGWMGAMQAQDFAMAKWAVGVRLPNSTEQTIAAAFDNGDLIRTHLLRPTWHIASAEDIYWLLELSAPQNKSAVKARHKELEITATEAAKSSAVIEKALLREGALTRDALAAEFERAHIAVYENRATHFLYLAELNGLICSGASQNGKPTYSLLAERVPKKLTLTRDEALARLAGKYFTSHCPATAADFAWWSGLPAVDVKRALEMIKPDFQLETISSQAWLLPSGGIMPVQPNDSLFLLPAFDEFLISYKDRSASLPLEKDYKKIISKNGIFRPVIVANGQVVGLWKRTLKKEKVRVEAEFFRPPDNFLQEGVEKAALNFGRFLQKEVELDFTKALAA